MDITIQKQYWTEEEIIAEVETRTGKTPVVTLDGLNITLDFAEALAVHEENDITAYFSAEQDLPTVEGRIANDGLRDAVKTLAQSTAGVALNDLTALQIKVLVAILLWQAGAIDADLKIKPLAE